MFFDAVRLKTLQAVEPQPRYDSLRGTGFGLRLSGPAGLSLEADVAKALVGGDITRSGEVRVHARALWAY